MSKVDQILHEALTEPDPDPEDSDIWMPQFSGAPGGVQLRESDPERLHAIVSLLRENPILIEPALNWITQKIGEINAATLATLYTKEQLAELRQRMEAQ